MIGSDDVLACFIAGNAFTWDDWFRLETLDDSLQPTIDMLLNLTIFLWFGAICPWESFANNDSIPIYRLVFLGILILLLRRLPFVFALHRYIRQIEEKRQAIFVGFFGPIGVSGESYATFNLTTLLITSYSHLLSLYHSRIFGDYYREWHTARRCKGAFRRCHDHCLVPCYLQHCKYDPSWLCSIILID
jgi:NhaP-type Na+/H+ or K+/H+ antiporter